MIADRETYSKIVLIVIGMRSTRYREDIVVVDTGPYSVVLGISIGMQSAQYYTVNATGIADTGPTVLLSVGCL